MSTAYGECSQESRPPPPAAPTPTPPPSAATPGPSPQLASALGLLPPDQRSMVEVMALVLDLKLGDVTTSMTTQLQSIAGEISSVRTEVERVAEVATEAHAMASEARERVKKCRASQRRLSEKVQHNHTEVKQDLAVHEERYDRMFAEMVEKLRGLKCEMAECNLRAANVPQAPPTPSASSRPSSSSDFVTTVIGNFSGMESAEVVRWVEVLLSDLGVSAEVYCRRKRPRVAFVEFANSGEAWRAMRRLKKGHERTTPSGHSCWLGFEKPLQMRLLNRRVWATTEWLKQRINTGHPAPGDRGGFPQWPRATAGTPRCLSMWRKRAS